MSITGSSYLRKKAVSSGMFMWRDFQEGNIEYIAVSEQFRRKGYGAPA